MENLKKDHFNFSPFRIYLTQSVVSVDIRKIQLKEKSSRFLYKPKV